MEPGLSTNRSQGGNGLSKMNHLLLLASRSERKKGEVCMHYRYLNKHLDRLVWMDANYFTILSDLGLVDWRRLMSSCILLHSFESLFML